MTTLMSFPAINWYICSRFPIVFPFPWPMVCLQEYLGDVHENLPTGGSPCSPNLGALIMKKFYKLHDYSMNVGRYIHVSKIPLMYFFIDIPYTKSYAIYWPMYPLESYPMFLSWIPLLLGLPFPFPRCASMPKFRWSSRPRRVEKSFGLLYISKGMLYYKGML